MNGPLIVATAAFLLLLPPFNNADAAGPYDGEWTGTATSTGERCKRAVVKFTVEGQVVLGQAGWRSRQSSIARPSPRAPEKSLPFAIEDLEGPLKLIPGELSPEGLKAYRRPKRAAFVNSSIDVGRIALKPCFA